MTFCPSCGASVPEDAAHCTACGHDMNTPAPASAAPAAAAPASAAPGVRTRPTGVTVLAIIYFLGGVMLALLGLLAFAGGGILASVFPDLGGAIGGAIVAVIGVVFIVFAAAYFAMGAGFLKGWTAVWWIALVFAALGILGGLGALLAGDVTQILWLALNGFIAWYLFRPDVKLWFGRPV